MLLDPLWAELKETGLELMDAATEMLRKNLGISVVCATLGFPLGTSLGINSLRKQPRET